MSPRDDHADWDDELAAYALDALEPSEAAAFEGHLVHCDRCEAGLARLAPALARLPLSVAPADPPPALRRRIMDAVQADASPRAPTPPKLRRGRRPGDWRAWLLRPAPIGALAAALVATFLAGFALRGGDDAAHPPTTVAARALTRIPVGATLVERDGRWQLDVDRLPRLAGDRVYQVWVANANATQLTPSSLFVLSRDGRAQVPLSDRLARGQQVLVTREPAGGSAQPTSAPLLQARV
jgi:anti-sigma-K factor RskA